MKPKIIGIVGPIRAGKSLAANYLKVQYGYDIGANSRILKDIAAGLEMPPTRDNLKKIGNSIFQVLGNDAIAIFRLRNLTERAIVIEGIRYFEEISAYRAEKSFKLLGITASEDTRHARALALAHEGKDQKIDVSAFRQLSAARSETQVNQLVNSADFIIRNDSTIEALQKQIDQAMAIWSIDQ